VATTDTTDKRQPSDYFLAGDSAIALVVERQKMSLSYFPNASAQPIFVHIKLQLIDILSVGQQINKKHLFLSKIWVKFPFIANITRAL
jgi:hypothetical protein